MTHSDHLAVLYSTDYNNRQRSEEKRLGKAFAHGRHHISTRRYSGMGSAISETRSKRCSRVHAIPQCLGKFILGMGDHRHTSGLKLLKPCAALVYGCSEHVLMRSGMHEATIKVALKIEMRASKRSVIRACGRVLIRIRGMTPTGS